MKTGKALTKDFVVDGRLVFVVGTKLYQHDNAGFNRDGSYTLPSYQGKPLTIPAEYFAE